MQKQLVLCSLLVSLSLASPARAQENYEKLPGYVDFSSLDILGEEEASIEIFLKGTLLNLVSAATKAEDPDLADVLWKLKLIRVQKFPWKYPAVTTTERQLADLAKTLEKKGWEAVVRVREKRNDNVYVYLKSQTNKIVGIAIMATEPGEGVTLVNIVGDIEPAQLGRLGSKFNIDALDSIRLEMKSPDDKKSKK